MKNIFIITVNIVVQSNTICESESKALVSYLYFTNEESKKTEEIQNLCIGDKEQFSLY